MGYEIRAKECYSEKHLIMLKHSLHFAILVYSHQCVKRGGKTIRRVNKTRKKILDT